MTPDLPTSSGSAQRQCPQVTFKFLSTRLFCCDVICGQTLAQLTGEKEKVCMDWGERGHVHGHIILPAGACSQTVTPALSQGCLGDSRAAVPPPLSSLEGGREGAS